MNTADLIRARQEVLVALGDFEETEPHAFDRLFPLLDAYADTAYEVGRSAERAAATARAMR